MRAGGASGSVAVTSEMQAFQMQVWFRKAAHATAEAVGTSWAFIAAVAVTLLWGLSGPYFHYQHGNDECNVSEGVPNSEHPESRRESDADEVGRIDPGNIIREDGASADGIVERRGTRRFAQRISKTTGTRCEGAKTNRTNQREAARFAACVGT